jgi:outer membrane biosynthesis protein TonB
MCCYPLQNRISLRFQIGRDGAVSNVSNAGSDMFSDAVACMIRKMYGVSFPQPPKGRPMTVTYPLVFTLDGD